MALFDEREPKVNSIKELRNNRPWAGMGEEPGRSPMCPSPARARLVADERDCPTIG